MFGTIVLSALILAPSIRRLESLADRPGAPAKQAWGAEPRRANVDKRIKNVRVIQDPAIGLSWRVESDPLHPAGPRRLIELPDAVPCRPKQSGRIGASERTVLLISAQKWVVRKGEPLLISHDTERVHASLTAVALGSGGVGDSINVRLRFADKVVRARIAGSGRALLIDGEREVHR